MKKKIVLNPGHLITAKRGFAWPNETEGSNNMKTVLLIERYLKEYDCEVVIVSQNDGTPFNQLGAKHPDATLFYSHHTNSFNGRARGTEVFYHYGRSLAQNIAVRTAKLLNTVTRDTKAGDKGAKRNTDQFKGAGYSVINQAVKAGVKYQLMGEIGFHDNPNEVKHIVNKRDEIAFAIADEIAKYLKLVKKPIPPHEDTIVANAAVHIREKASSKSTSLGVCQKGEKAIMTGLSGSWVQVEYKNKKGYSFVEYWDIPKTLVEKFAPKIEVAPPVAEPLKEVVAPEGKLYRVALGAYKKRGGAEDLLNKAKEAGLSPYIVIIDDPKTK